MYTCKYARLFEKGGRNTEHTLKAVLFDFDGTIADTGRGIINCVKKVLKDNAIEEKDESRLRYFIGPPLVVSFRHLFGLDEDTAQEYVRQYRVYYSQGGMYELDLYGGIPETLERIRAAGPVMGIASSKPGVYLQALLEHLGIAPYFSCISAPEIGTVNPPKRELIAAAMEKLNVRPEECVMVGDRFFDIEGGAQAGVRTIGAAYGYGGRAEMEEYNATWVAETTTEIAELIEKL